MQAEIKVSSYYIVEDIKMGIPMWQISNPGYSKMDLL